MQRNKLDRIADAISDGGSIEWDVELASAPASLVSSLRRLRQLGELANAFRAVEAPEASPTAPRPLFRWGHLEARSRLGRGSFGDVYLAIDSRLQRPVALKLRRRRSNGATPSPRRFLEEARRLARVSHPNVVIVHGADIHRGRAGFWTELITGETLASRLVAAGALEVNDVMKIGLELSRALGAVHAAGLVHGDVKAENVMRDEGGRTVLMDFGAASRLDPDARGLTDSPFLTPGAAAPEVLDGAPPHPTADIYSLGVLLYRLVSGAYPIEAQTFAELQDAHRREQTRSLADRRSDLPPEFVATVDRALASRAIDRFQSASEFEGALRAALRAGAPSASFVGTQSLRALIEEEGRISEPLCLEIARGIVLELRPLHDSGRVHGRIDLDTVQVLSDGTVSLGATADSAAGDSSPSTTNQRDDLRALGGLLGQLVAGELGAQVSPFFRELVRELLESDAESALSSAALAEILEQGPRGAWWRARAREVRLRSRRAPRRISMPRETGLHGRDPQVEELLALWGRAKSGEGQVALVVGEAGIGKSRLVDHFVGLLEQKGESFHFLFGSHPPGGGATALGAYCDAYRDHLGGERLEETLAEYLPETPHLAATLAALFQGAPTGGDRSTRDSMQSAFVELTRALSAEQPTIVMVDDLHFAPEESRSLFAALAAAGRGQPLLLLGTARPELPEEWVAAIARLDHARTVVLPRLSQEQVDDLLSDAFHSTPLSFPFTEELGVRSDGNPYFLLEIVRSLRARVVDGDESAIASTLLRGVPVPFSIAQLVAARVAALDTEDDRELLDLACCVGFRFDPSLVAEAAQIEPVRALRRFARIETRHGLVRADGGDYVFDHHQAQEFVYSALGVQLRQHYHSAIATALRSRGVMDGEAAAAICAHELRGIDPSRGLALLVPALDHLESHYANAAAIDLAERALAAPGLLSGSDRARVLLRRGARLSFIGRRAEAQSAYEEAYALVDPDSDPQLGGEIEGNLGGQFRIAGDHPRAIEFLERGIRHAEIARDLSSEGKTRLELGTVFFHTGRHVEAETEYRRAVEIARDRGDRANLCQAESYLSSLLSECGRLVEAEHLIRKSLSEARELGNVNLELSGLANLASMLLDQGRSEDAIEASTQMLELARRFGVRSGESIAWINLGCGLSAIGRYEEGRARLEQAVRVGPELRTRDHEAYALCHLGLIFGLTGDLARSQDALDACTALCAEFDFGWLNGEVRSVRGAVAELHEDFAGSERWQLEALAIARQRQNASGIARAQISLGRVTAQLGRPDEARSHLQEAARAALESAAIPETVAAQAELALLGVGDLPEAIARFGAEHAHLAHWDQLRTRFRFYQATVNPAHLEAARRLLAETLAAVPEAERARVVDSVPLYRAIEDAT